MQTLAAHRLGRNRNRLHNEVQVLYPNEARTAAEPGCSPHTRPPTTPMFMRRGVTVVAVAAASSGAAALNLESLGRVQLQPIVNGRADPKAQVAASTLWKDTGAILFAVCVTNRMRPCETPCIPLEGRDSFESFLLTRRRGG